MVNTQRIFVFLQIGTVTLPYKCRQRFLGHCSLSFATLRIVDSSISNVEEDLGKYFNNATGFTPLDVYRKLRSFDSYVNEIGPALIIDRPRTTMSHKLLNVDMTSIRARILACAKKEERAKPLLAIVRGSGGGKTRLIEETRKELLKGNDVLPIAITFNNLWINYFSCNRSDLTDSYKLVYEISYRILASYYGLTPSSFDPRQLFDNFFSRFSSNTDPGHILLGVIRHCVLQTQIQLGKPVTTFVLLIDESLRPIKGLNLTSPPDPYEIVRKAVLDGVVVDGVKNTLIMSFLKPRYLGESLSHRAIQPIRLPSILPAVEILETWWLIDYNSTIVSDEDKLTITVMASLVSRLPRLTEIAGSILREDIDAHITTHGGNILFHIDRSYVVSWLTRIVEDWSSKYNPNSIFPSPEKMHALVYQQAISLDNEVLELVQNSIFTNSILQFGENVNIVPESSYLALYATAKTSAGSTDMKVLLKQAFFIAINVLYKKTFKEEDLFESMVPAWLEVRLQALKDVGIDTIPLHILLGIQDISNRLLTMLNSPSVKFLSFDTCSKKVPDPKNVTAFIDYFNTLSFSNQSVQILTPSAKSPYDLLLLYHDVEKKPHFVFMDFKSKRIDIRHKSKSDYSNEETRQSEKLYKIIQSLTTLNITKSSYTQSLSDRNFVYIYMSTKKSRILDELNIMNSPYVLQSINTAITYSEDVENFFGVAYDFYRPLRSVNVQRGQQEKRKRS